MAHGNAADEPIEPLFHYTSEKSLFSIIESEKFWFTSIYYMDDKEELTFGYNISRSILLSAIADGDKLTRMFCEELVDEEDLRKIKSLFEFYSISFGLKDDAQQWESYGDKAGGVAIGLSKEFFHLQEIKEEELMPEEHIFFGKVIYGDVNAKKRHSIVIDAAIETIRNANNEGAITSGWEAMMFFRHIAVEMSIEMLWNCVTTKDQSWSHQNETRLLALNNLKNPQIRIHNSPERPRVELPQPLLKKCITEIMLGPKASAATAEKIEKFLKANNLSNIPITKSNHSL